METITGSDQVTTTSTQTLIGGGAVATGATVAGENLSTGENALGAVNLSGAASNTPVVLGPGSTAGPIQITQASPQDVALAGQAYQDSLAIVQGAEAGNIALAEKALVNAQDVTKAASPINPTRLAVIFGVLLLVGAGAYFYFKRKGA